MLRLIRFGALLALWACPAAQAEGSFLREGDYRVATIAWRLATAAPQLCPRRGALSGIAFHHLSDYEPADRPALAAQGLDRGPGILAVVTGSPADQAGLRAGDVLHAVNGKGFEAPATILARKDRRSWRTRTDAGEAQFHDQLDRGPASLTVLRGGETLTLILTPRTGCLLRIRLAYSEQKKAVTTGANVTLTSGLLDIVRNDDELAFVIAHEMAHAQLEHGARLRKAGVPMKGELRGFGRNGKLIRETEAEADQLGGRMTIAAGFDLARGVLVLPLLGGSVTFFGLFQTHADDEERIRSMRALAISEQRPARAP